MITEKKYTVPCIRGIVDKTNIIQVDVPGSKSITNRALLLATLGAGKTRLKGVLFSDDSRHFLKCVEDLGFATNVDEDGKTVEVTGLGGKVAKKEASVYVGSAGTAARFLAAYLGVSEGTYHMDASEQMRKRPMAPLLNSLQELGCGIECGEKEGFFPFTLRGNGFGKKEITVDIEKSSQFLSALLISGVLAPQGLNVKTIGTHGMAYIDMTIRMMEQFGVSVNREAEASFSIPCGQSYQALDYQIEPDVSAASYFYAMGALLGVPVQVRNVTEDSMQGDKHFLYILKKMGCRLKNGKDGIVLYPSPSGKLQGVVADMSACSDQAITLAAVAPFAEGPTTITGIGHIKFQECDRMAAITSQLRKMGIVCEETEDSITIYPGCPKSCEVETFDDHRMAMGFSLIGLMVEGITILDPGCCRKTFEDYFETLELCVAQMQK